MLERNCRVSVSVSLFWQTCCLRYIVIYYCIFGSYLYVHFSLEADVSYWYCIWLCYWDTLWVDDVFTYWCLYLLASYLTCRLITHCSLITRHAAAKYSLATKLEIACLLQLSKLVITFLLRALQPRLGIGCLFNYSGAACWTRDKLKLGSGRKAK